MIVQAATRAAAGRAPNTVVGTVLGVGYLAAGVVALAVALGAGMAPGEASETAASPARMAAYLALGGALVLAATRGTARTANTVLGATYLIAGLVLLYAGGAQAQLLALNHPDNVVHLSSAALLLGVGRTQE